MEREYFVKLACSLYKVTELLPEREPLRYSMRERAVDVLADAILLSDRNPTALTGEQKKRVFEQILGNIEILQSYFELAKSQDWVKKENFLVLEKEYGRLGREIWNGCLTAAQEGGANTISKSKVPANTILKEPGAKLHVQNKNVVLKKRQKRILQLLRERKATQVKDVREILPEVSKRTLRRDFEFLLSRGLVERVGEKNDTSYRLALE